jgi:small-conductance mechanosensitive channel
VNELRDSLSTFSQQLLADIVEHTPAVLGALLLLLVGWVVARLLRALSVRGLKLLDNLLARFTTRPAPAVKRSLHIFADLIFWIVLLLFISAATQVLGLSLFSQWLTRLVEYLPSLAVGLLIIAAGILLSRFAAELVRSASSRMAAPQREALAQLAQGATLVTALLVGADQIGIHITWVAVLAVIVLASLLGGVMLAASLGARGYVENLIGARHLRDAYQVGDCVRVAGHEGRIVDISNTSLLLETHEGRLSLPGRVFNDEAVLLLTRPPGS